VESYSGPLKRLSDKSRVTQWGKIFAKTLTAERIEQAAAERTAFANDTVAELCGLIGLAGDRPQMHYGDFESEPDSVAAALYFTKKVAARPALGDGQISLRNYFDRHNSRKLLIYPASWPMPLEQEETLLRSGAATSCEWSRHICGYVAISPTRWTKRPWSALQSSPKSARATKSRNGQIVRWTISNSLSYQYFRSRTPG
jgi:hypothetical protein